MAVVAAPATGVCAPAMFGTKSQHGTEAALSMSGCLIPCTAA